MAKKTAKLAIKVELDPRRVKLIAAQEKHKVATQQFDDALDDLEKARKARDTAAADLLAAQEACVSP